MRKIIVIPILLLLTISLSAITPNPTNSILIEKSIVKNETTLNDFTSLKKKDLKKRLGRKLTFKENIGLFFMKRFIKKAIKKDPTIGKISSSVFFGACSKIVLKNGDIIEADVSQITPTEVKYRRCGKPDDPEIVLNKRDVLSIQASDGAVIYRDTGRAPSLTPTPRDDYRQVSTQIDTRKMEPYAIWAAVFALLIPIVGIVLGIISLTRINKNPDKYKGAGWAWFGIIFSIIWVLLVVASASAA